MVATGTSPHTATLVSPIFAKRFHRHYCGQPALLNVTVAINTHKKGTILLKCEPAANDMACCRTRLSYKSLHWGLTFNGSPPNIPHNAQGNTPTSGRISKLVSSMWERVQAPSEPSMEKIPTRSVESHHVRCVYAPSKADHGEKSDRNFLPQGCVVYVWRLAR